MLVIAFGIHFCDAFHQLQSVQPNTGMAELQAEPFTWSLHEEEDPDLQKCAIRAIS